MIFVVDLLIVVVDEVLELLKVLLNLVCLCLLCVFMFEECCVSEFEDLLGVSQFYVFGQLVCMWVEGLVLCSCDGWMICYCIVDVCVCLIFECLYDVFCSDVVKFL